MEVSVFQMPIFDSLALPTFEHGADCFGLRSNPRRDISAHESGWAVYMPAVV